MLGVTDRSREWLQRESIRKFWGYKTILYPTYRDENTILYKSYSQGIAHRIQNKQKPISIDG